MRVQPVDARRFENTFATLSGENVLQVYECQELGTLRCGPKSIIALTDTRLISRYQQANCCCCVECDHADTATYLRDIEIMRESAPNLLHGFLFSLSSYTCCCFPLTIFCPVRMIDVSNGSGTQRCIFKKSDVVDAANEISSMVHRLRERS